LRAPTPTEVLLPLNQLSKSLGLGRIVVVVVLLLNQLSKCFGNKVFDWWWKKEGDGDGMLEAENSNIIT
jgi:hypothetical protein